MDKEEKTQDLVSQQNTAPKSEEPRLAEKKSPEQNPFNQIKNIFWQTKAKKTYTLMSLTFGFIALLLALAIYPTLQSITQITKKIDDYKIIKTDQDQKISNISNLTRQANSALNNEITFFDTVFYADSNVEDSVYRDILEKTKSEKVDFESMRTGETITNEELKVKYRLYEVTVLSLNIENINKLVEKIDESKKLYIIQNTTFAFPNISSTSETSSNEERRIKSTIKFFAYFYE